MAESEKTKLTVKEFLMWIKGVEEMQDADWIPSATQWKKIRDKINDIDDTPVYHVKKDTQQPAINVRDVEPTRVEAAVDNTPIRFAIPALSNAPVMPPANLGSAPFANADMPNIPIKTPTIDSSNGTYTSTFA